jgi:hypothetical protein
MMIPEGSQEHDFNGRRLVAGRLGRFEVYVSWVWANKRYLRTIGCCRGVFFFRRANWVVA